MEIKKIINDYIKYSKVRDEFLIDFDNRKHNYATQKIVNIQNKIKKDRNLLESFIDEMFDNKESIKLQMAICNLCIAENYRKTEAIQKLLTISKEDIGLFDIHIKMALVDYGLLNAEDIFLDDWRDRVKRV